MNDDSREPRNHRRPPGPRPSGATRNRAPLPSTSWKLQIRIPAPGSTSSSFVSPSLGTVRNPIETRSMITHRPAPPIALGNPARARRIPHHKGARNLGIKFDEQNSGK